MGVVGFSFTKIHVEKKAPASGKIDINNNVSIMDVSETQMALGNAKQKGVKFSFEFLSKYDPGIGEMIFAGELLYISEKQEDIIRIWKKEKKVSKDVMSEVINTILTRCNMEALILSRDINLPPPVPLNIPKVK